MEYASFYEGPEGEARLQRAMQHRAILDRLFPEGSLLGDFYRGFDHRTGTSTQVRLHTELGRAVGEALGMGEEIVKAALAREVASFVACARLVAAGTTQRQLAIYFANPAADQATSLIEQELAA